MKTLLNQISKKSVEIQELKSAIAKTINALPDNSRIKRISENPRCFVMSSKDVFGNYKYSNTDKDGNPKTRFRQDISVFYHDFKAQYKVIAEVVETAAEPSAILHSIIETGTHKKNGNYYNFHPDVLKHLAELIA